MAVVRLDADAARGRLDELAAVLVDCVDGGASVNFLAPLDPARARRFWLDLATAMATDGSVLLAAEDDGAVVGTVVVRPAPQENQPHRADVAKLLVHRRARGRGVASALMAAAEREASRLGRTLLVLDTETGSPAERLYRHLGWTAAGAIPGYALTADGRPCSATFFWKQVPPA